MKVLVFDTETTGIPRHPDAKDEYQPRMIEFGGVLIDEEGESLSELSVLINPGVPIEHLYVKGKTIEAITGITDADVKDSKSFLEASRRIADIFAEADFLIAHNLPFDKTIIQLELKRNGIEEWPWPARQICTVQEHAEEWGRRPKLLELYEHYNGEPLQQTHRALDDVYALVSVVVKSGVLKA